MFQIDEDDVCLSWFLEKTKFQLQMVDHEMEFEVFSHGDFLSATLSGLFRKSQKHSVASLQNFSERPDWTKSAEVLVFALRTVCSANPLVSERYVFDLS